MKITDRSILKLARLYQLLGDNDGLLSIRNIEKFDHETFVSLKLTIAKQTYAGLFGSDVDENLAKDVFSDEFSSLVAIENPLDNNTWATPFLGKSAILYRLVRQSERLDIHLVNHFDKSKSRSYWQKLIKLGLVTVDGKVAQSPSSLVSPNSDVSIDYLIEKSDDHNVPIIYQDNDIIVINKPAGVLTHAKGGIDNESTVASLFSHLTSFDDQNSRPGIVHRLDRDTSGVMVIAKNKSVADILQKQFASRTVNKTYYAVVEGVPKISEAIISLPIGRNPKRPSSFKVSSNGKEAETHYQIITESDSIALVKLMPKTGRTHQLRVHLAHIGNPIVGDRIYGKAGGRLMLHAYKLSFALPSTGELTTFTAELPKEFLDRFSLADEAIS